MKMFTDKSAEKVLCMTEFNPVTSSHFQAALLANLITGIGNEMCVPT